jgi:hypothetical protein
LQLQDVSNVHRSPITCLQTNHHRCIVTVVAMIHWQQHFLQVEQNTIEVPPLL